MSYIEFLRSLPTKDSSTLIKIDTTTISQKCQSGQILLLTTIMAENGSCVFPYSEYVFFYIISAKITDRLFYPSVDSPD